MTPALREAAEKLRKLGTHGDTVLAHINPREALLLDWLSDHTVDYPRNRRTGLPTFGDGDGTGTAGGGGGEDGNNGAGSVGGPGGGVGGPGDPGPGSSYSAGAGYGFSDAPAPGFGPNGEGLSINDISGFGGPPTATIGENGEGMAAFAGAPGQLTRDAPGLMGYAPAGTIRRAWQEWREPSIPKSKLSMPTGTNPGIARGLVGLLGGGTMAALMGVGMAMDAAMTPEEREASAKEMAERGRLNSGGNDTPNERIAQWIRESNQPAQPVQPFKPASIQDLGSGDSLIRKLAFQPGLLGAIVGGGLLGWPT